MSKIVDYIKAVRGELSHVSWPSTPQAVAYTALIIGISIAIALVLGAFDYLFTFAIEKIIILSHSL